ncbi:MAG: thrombospondin type 3 repeat-containing protein [Pseudomonadota bacterium]
MTFKTTLKTTLSALGLLLLAPAHAQSSSASYNIEWDVVDGGGGTAMSASYTLTDSVAQPSALGESASASYRLQPGFLAPPDFDADGVRNFMDNCIQDENTDQRDSNGDGFGNVCDADLNNDGVTNVIDLGLLRQRFFTADADADLNGDGVVNVIDLGIMRLRFFTAPGPSGNAP